MLKFAKMIDQVIYVVLRVIIILSFVTMVLLVGAQVYVRFFTTSSLTWSEELARYLMAYMIFFSAVLVAREKGHISIKDAVSKLPKVGAKIVSVISLVLQMVFFGIVIWGAWKLFPTAAMRGSPANGIPMHLVYLCVPISCGLMLLYCIRDLAGLFAKGETK